ncbi:MAG TPA: EamA family transporter [Candidatus Bathyarchaeia archaeon]|nr:EamA family transporter [Candidatus Bathyarchaeia archaeon]
MTAVHVTLALAVAVIWGLAFVATRIALDVVSPPQLTAVRFLIAAVPALWLTRPPIPWRTLVSIGLFLFAGQFLFQFFGIALGMPPGLASIVIHTQALFTIVFAAWFLGERVSGRQWTGTTVAFAGLAAIAGTVGHDLTVTGLCFTGLAAMSFGVGNVLLKRLPPVDTLQLVSWLSLVPPVLALALSAVLDGPRALWTSLGAATLVQWGAMLYLGVVATVLAYAIWGWLLRRYAAAAVAPFSLLIPFVAAGGSSLAFGERFGPMRLAGMGLVMLGLAVIVTAGRDALSSRS